MSVTEDLLIDRRTRGQTFHRLPFQVKQYRRVLKSPREARAEILPEAMNRIAIYEQDYLTRTLLREWLSDAGYRVSLGTLPDANHRWTADLVIVSVYMPKDAGTLWVGNIKKAHPGAPVIAISGQFRYGLSARGATAECLGVQQVIAKPLIRGDLLEAVQGIIGMPE